MCSNEGDERVTDYISREGVRNYTTPVYLRTYNWGWDSYMVSSPMMDVTGITRKHRIRLFNTFTTVFRELDAELSKRTWCTWESAVFMLNAFNRRWIYQRRYRKARGYNLGTKCKVKRFRGWNYHELLPSRY